MIGNIYYIIGIIMLIRLIYGIINFKKIHSLREWLIKFKEISGKVPTKDDFRSKEEISLYESNSIMILFEFIWILCGLLSGNKLIFLGLIVYFALLKIITKRIGFTMLDRVAIFVNIILRFSVYSWMIINHFN